jgi:peptide/nickel transport system substrate-binding protein
VAGRGVRARRALAAAVLAAALAPSAAGARSVPLHPARPGTVTVAFPAMPAGIDPLRTGDQYSLDVELLLDDPLYVATPAGGYAPDLARSWQASDGGRVWRYALDPRARWTDGRRVTAQDVVWSLEAYRSGRDASPLRDAFSVLAWAHALGPEEVEVRLRRPWPGWMGLLAQVPILPAPTGGRGAAPAPTDGPYRLARWDRAGGSVALTANPGYFRTPPRVAQLVLRAMAPAAALAALRRGTVQVAILPPSWAAAVRASPSLVAHLVPGRGLDLLVMDTGGGPLGQAAVRRALALATRRAALVPLLCGGPGSVPGAPWPPAVAASSPPPPYDPGAARALLTAAGWRPGPGGVRRRGGRALRVVVLYADGTMTVASALARMAAQWRRVGVELLPRPVGFAALAARLRSGAFQAAALGVAFGVGADPHALLQGAGGKAYLPLAACSGMVATGADLRGFVPNPQGPDLYQPQRWFVR